MQHIFLSDASQSGSRSFRLNCSFNLDLVGMGTQLRHFERSFNKAARGSHRVRVAVAADLLRGDLVWIGRVGRWAFLRIKLVIV